MESGVGKASTACLSPASASRQAKSSIAFTLQKVQLHFNAYGRAFISRSEAASPMEKLAGGGPQSSGSALATTQPHTWPPKTGGGPLRRKAPATLGETISQNRTDAVRVTRRPFGALDDRRGAIHNREHLKSPKEGGKQEDDGIPIIPRVLLQFSSSAGAIDHRESQILASDSDDTGDVDLEYVARGARESKATRHPGGGTTTKICLSEAKIQARVILSRRALRTAAGVWKSGGDWRRDALFRL